MSPNKLICPVCNSSNFFIKYEATYVYSYALDSDAPGSKNIKEFLPFMYDNREQKDIKQYIQCNNCGAVFPCVYNEWGKGIDINALQGIISSNDVYSDH